MDEHSNMVNNCGCNTRSESENICLAVSAMAYVPWQEYTETLELSEALKAGTIFPELEKPFLMAGRCSANE